MKQFREWESSRHEKTCKLLKKEYFYKLRVEFSRMSALKQKENVILSWMKMKYLTCWTNQMNSRRIFYIILDIQDQVKLAQPSTFVRDDVPKFQYMAASRLKTVFTVFSQYLLKTSNAKKQLVSIHDRYISASSNQICRQAFNTWKSRSSRRAIVYTFATEIRSVIESIVTRSSRSLKSKSFYEVRLYSKQLARCDKLADRIRSNRLRAIMTRSFEKLSANAKWSLSCRRALNLLSSTLKARSVKSDVFTEIKSRADRRTFHFSCAKHLLISIRKSSKRVAFEGISQYARTRLEHIKTADTYYGIVKFCQKKRIFDGWHKILYKRKQLEHKGDILSANSDLRLKDSVYRLWHDRVINSKFSLYGREQALSKCLWQARAIRAIDVMISRLCVM